MESSEYLALIHAEIDGELDAAQRAQLARRLLADPDLRAEREDLRRLCSLLDGMDDVEPPAQLRANILRALPMAAAPLGHPRAVPRWRYFALAAGILGAAILVLESVKGPGPASTELTGTIAAARAPVILDTVRLEAPIGGRVSLYRDGNRLGLALELASGAPVDVVVTSAGQTLTVNGLGTSSETRKVALPEAATGGRVDLTFLMSGREIARATLTTAGAH